MLNAPVTVQTVFSLIIVGLAASRSHRLIALDSITQPFRYFWRSKAFEFSSDPHVRKIFSAPIRWVLKLTQCHACTTVWFALIYLKFFHQLKPVLFLLAAAQIAQHSGVHTEDARMIDQPDPPH